MNKTSLYALAAAAMMTAPYMVSAQQSADMRDTVKDKQGQIILNRFDNCVRTRWQSEFDECMAEAGVVAPPQADREFLTVYFAFDAAELTPAAMAKLDQVATMLKQSQAVESINIVGYADPIGNTDYNYNLSRRRGDAVRQYLTSQGYVNTNKVDVRALGEEAPVSNCEGMARNEKIACLWRDRRVEIELNLKK